MRPEAGPGGAQAAGAGIRPSAFVMIDALLLTGFDADHDARIDEDELTQGITREFSRADENGDGSIAPLEFGAWSRAALAGGQGAPFRLDFDRNVDGAVTREEFHAELTARAREYDRDHDGVLSRSEFVREAPRASEMPGPMGKMKMKGRGRPPPR
jgi:Ca2+-binding EF-hand superfamily protein